MPTRTFGGVALFWTIWEMKFAVMPMIAMREMACKMRFILKVTPSIP